MKLLLTSRECQHGGTPVVREVYWDKARTRTGWARTISYDEDGSGIVTNISEPRIVRIVCPALVYVVRRTPRWSDLFIYGARETPVTEKSEVFYINLPNNVNPVCFGVIETKGLSSRELVDLYWNTTFTTEEKEDLITPMLFERVSLHSRVA